MLPKDLVDKYYVWKGDTFSKNKDSFEKLAKEGQSPQYMIISCVDSRVDPNSIFNSIISNYSGFYVTGSMGTNQNKNILLNNLNEFDFNYLNLKYFF